MKQMDVLCLGLINLNLMLGPVDAHIFQRDVTLIPGFSALVGGDAVNEAVVLSALGNATGVAGKVGADEFGEIALAALQKAGVNTSQIRAATAYGTSSCAVLFGESGVRNFVSYRGANEAFCLEDFDFSILPQLRAISVGSMFALKSLDGAGVCQILQKAREQGVHTLADMKSDTYGIGYAGIVQVMPWLDYFLPSLDEAAYLTGLSAPEEMAQRFLADGAGHVVIKLGAEGCYYRSAFAEGYLPAFPVAAVDTTGAGDNFVAGFLHGLLRGLDLRGCALVGSATGAASVTQVGATAAVKNIQQIYHMLQGSAEGRALVQKLCKEEPT